MPSGEALLVDVVCIALHRGEGRLPELQSPCRGLNGLRAGSFFLMQVDGLKMSHASINGSVSIVNSGEGLNLSYRGSLTPYHGGGGRGASASYSQGSW